MKQSRVAKRRPAGAAAEPILSFDTQRGWEEWLDDNHSEHGPIWLCIGKKNCALASVTYFEAVESALCFGWIDSQKRSLDDRSWLQRFSKRKPKGPWSKVNRGKIDALIASGRMRDAGLAEVRAAKADGRWEAAYDSSSTAQVPKDFVLALAKNKRAKAFFADLKSTSRYAILYKLMSAKRPETRAARIRDFVAMLARSEAPYLIKPNASPKAPRARSRK